MMQRMGLDGVWQDLGFMLRSCRRQPGFALTALATLTLGIGACTAVFSVVNAVVLRPVPYPDPDRIVLVGTNTGASAPKLAAWAQADDVFTGLAAYRGGRVNVTTTDDLQHGLALQVPYAQADVNFFALFGAAVAQGRGFTLDDDRPHEGRVVLLSHRFWQRHFDGDPAVIGRRVLLDNDPHTVIGVLSERFDPEHIAGFAYWGIPEVWVPLQLDRQSLNQGNDMLAAARLAPGVTLDMARARLQGIAAEFRRTFPGVLLPNVEFGVKSIHDAVTGDARTSLWLLTGAVGFVLLIACANVANLLLARATARGRELAIRAALGAGRARIVSQLLTESLVLAFASGACGLIVGVAGVRALLAINPGNIPRIGVPGASDPLPLDWRVFAFTVDRLAGDGPRVRRDPGAARLSWRSARRDEAGGRARGCRRRRPSAHDTVHHCHHGGGARRCASDWRGAAGSQLDRAPCRRTRVRSAQRAHDANDLEGATIREQRQHGALDRRGEAPRRRAAWRRGRGRDLFRAGAGLPHDALHDHRPPGAGAVSRHRPLGPRLAWLFRGPRDPAAPRPPLHGA